MANSRYVYEYGGRRYVIEAPTGSTEADLRAIVTGSAPKVEPVKAPPPKPEETGFLQDAKDVAISLGKGVVNLAKPFAYMAEQGDQYALAPKLVRSLLESYESGLEGSRSEADIALERARQQKVEEAAAAPGALARGISSARSFIEGPERPAASRTFLSDIADALSPTRAVAKLLPKTPEEAQREVTSVTSQFGSPKEALEFGASQIPATAATILTGGGARAAALASGLERAAAARIAERAAVTAGTTLNATDAGYSAAQDVLAKGGTQEEANRAFAIAAGGAALTSAAAAKIPGLEQDVFSTKARRPGIVRGAIRSAAGEAPQEFVEEAGAQLSQNVAKLGTAAEAPISEGVLSSGALGAIGGAGFAAPVGALQDLTARGETPPAGKTPPPPPGTEPLRTTTVSYPNRDDPTAPITRTLDVMSETDADGKVVVRDDTGRTFRMNASKLAEMEEATPAYASSTEAKTETPAAPKVDPATNLERLRLASGTPEGKKPAPRVISLANDLTEALAADDTVAAQDIIQKRTQALAKSRMAEATKAQRQAEIDEGQSIINDYRAEYGRARATGPAIVEAPATEPSSVEQARDQNAELAKAEAQAEALRAAEERLRLERESEFETASNIGQGSPASQAQAARQQLFQSIIEDDTIPNPAGAFRQALRDRGYTNVELNEAERRQLQARRGFTKPANIVPFTGENVEAEVIEPTPTDVKSAEPVEAEFTEVPSPLPPAPPEVVAGAAAPAPSRRAQLMAGTAIEPGVPATAFGEEPAPAPTLSPLPAAAELEGDQTDLASRQLDIARATGSSNAILAEVAAGEGELADVARRLLKVAQDFPVQVLTRDEFDARFPDEAGAQGLWNPGDGTIYLSDDMSVDHVPVHEIVHGILQQHIEGNTQEGRELLQIYNDFKALAPDSESYGFTNAQEFASEVLGNREFRSEIRNLTPQPGAPSILDRLKTLFRKVVGRIFKGDRADVGAVTDYIERVILLTEAAARKAAPKVTEERLPTYAGRSITEPRAGEDEATARDREMIAADYAVAQQMEQEGEDAATIRVATGWERNPYDNEWRYLQPDNRASETRLLDDLISDYAGTMALNEQAMNSDGSFNLSDLMDHNELYGIYPEARDIRVFVKDGGRRGLQGSYDPATKTITVYASAVDPLGTLLHEAQHWVQDKEGFAFGSSEASVWKDLTPEQKADEAKLAINNMKVGVATNREAKQIIAWLRKNITGSLGTDPSPERILEKLAPYFSNDPAADSPAIDIALDEISRLNFDREMMGLDRLPINKNQLASVEDGIDSEINDLETMIDNVEAWDPNDSQSPAAAIVRKFFRDEELRAYTRYRDTAGEIEARDVSQSKGLSREQLRQRGALGTERKRTPAEVVMTKAESTSTAASAAGPTTTVTPATTKGAKLGFLANMRGFMSDLYRKHMYKYSGALKLDNQLANALGVKTLPKEMSLEDRASMFETMRSGMLRDFRRMWLEPFKRALKASGIDPQDLSMYLWARSAPYRNALVAERNRDMPDGGSGLTNLEAEAITSFYEASPLMEKMEPLIKMHDRLVDWMIKQRVKYGIWSQEEADLLRKQQPFYTPLKGFAADGDMFAAGDENPHAGYDGKVQLGVRPKDYIKVTGRESMPFDPMSNLISDAMQLTQRIAKNEVGKRFLSIVRDFPDLLGNAVKVYTDKKPKIVNKGIAPPGSKKKTVGPLNMAANAKDFLVVKDGGENFYIEFDEKMSDGEQMKRMFDNMTPKELDTGLKFLVKLGGFKKQMLTRFSPVFWPINFIRDVQDAVITAYSEQARIGSPVEGKKVAFRTMVNLGRPSTWRAVGQYMSGHDPVKAEDAENVLLVSQMIQDGGEAGRQFVLDAETIATEIKKDVAVIKDGGAANIWGSANNKRRALVSIVDHINERLSLVPRFAAYKAAIDEGVAPDDAAKFALDSTLNLARKGEASQVVDNIWLFTNPAAQSLEKKKRIYGSKNGRKAMAGMMALGVALHFSNMMFAGDGDDDGENDYQEMDELTKMSNLIIYTGDGPPIKIPVGFLVGFETYLGQQMARMVTNDGSGIGILEAAGNALSAFFATQIPAGEKIGSITDVPKLAVPDVLTPAVDLWRNKNVFGGKIYPEP